MSTVLVTDAGRGSAVAFIRSLARAGHVVIAGDVSRVSAGCWSRSASSSFRYPDPYLEPTAAAEVLLERIVAHEVDVVIPITDATTKLVESLRDRLPTDCVIASAPAGAAAIAADKDRTVALADELGVPVPATRVVESADEARAVGDVLGWPVVVKPIRSLATFPDGSLSKLDVGYAFDAADLDDKVSSLGRGSAVLLQEFCAGDGVGVEVLADRGRILRSFSHRRVHEVPVTGGASAIRVGIPVDPILLEHTARMMAALDWTGLAMVEFKAGSNGDRLMEINGRPWGSLPLAVLSGVDFPADYVRLLTEGADGLEPMDPGGTIGRTARNLHLETLWIGSVLRGPRSASPVHPWPPRRAGLAAVLRLFSPKIHDDILSLRDPLASVVELLSIARNLARKATPGKLRGMVTNA